MGISSSNCNSAYDNNCYPNLVGKPVIGGTGVNTPKWDVNAFDFPFKENAQGQYIHSPQIPAFGNTQPYLLYGNPFADWDLGLIKHTKFGEGKYEVEFRFETFNTWNEANFSDPDTNPADGTFGLTSGAAPSRDMQFGLKFYW